MSRFAVFSVFLLFVVQAQAQMFSHGIPAGANSPEPDGRQHGIPSSVLSPTPIPPGVNVPGINVPSGRRFFFNGPLHRFGSPHNRNKVFVPVPVFYPVYGYGDAGYPADPYVRPSLEQTSDSSSSNSAPAPDQAQPAASDEMLRQAYLQGARDALKDTLEKERHGRYGDHYLDSREQEPPPVSRPAQGGRSEEATPAPARKEDSGPATVFIFKDGHQVETRNFAIMGDTLYDFSTSILRKVQLSDLDKDKTIQANEDRGITVKLP
ncbi:MAG: hypothetical protein ACM3SW_20715 [Actinomycetota bacterium]